MTNIFRLGRRRVGTVVERTKSRKHPRWGALRLADEYGQIRIVLLEHWVGVRDELPEEHKKGH